MAKLSASVNVDVVQKTELDYLRAELDELRKERDAHEHYPKGYVADLLKKFEDMNQLCIEAAIAMNNEKVSRHIKYVSWEDTLIGETGMARTGWYPEKLIKVTIEWVNESEASKGVEAA
jgi:hypothetical protein